MTEEQAFKIAKNIGIYLGRIYVRQRSRTGEMVGFPHNVFGSVGHVDIRQRPKLSLVSNMESNTNRSSRDDERIVVGLTKGGIGRA